MYGKSQAEETLGKDSEYDDLRSVTIYFVSQPISAHSYILYRNQSFVLQSKTNDWFLNEMQQRAEIGK